MAYVRRDGTFVAYRLVLPEDDPWRDAWLLARDGLAGDPTADRDDAMLRQALAARRAREATGRSFFDELAG